MGPLMFRASRGRPRGVDSKACLPRRILMTPPEVAKRLRVDPKRLRAEIRKHRLVPSHKHGAHYRLTDGDVQRIEQHFSR